MDAQQARRDAALEKLTAALLEYEALSPKPTEPTEPPCIEPTLKHCDPSAFHLGYNMILDAGGYMPGKIPVVVIPARPEDIRRYRRNKRTVHALLVTLGLTA
jgi:hypothetical protein